MATFYRQTIRCDGAPYTLPYRPHGSVRNSWAWVDYHSGNVVSIEMVDKLRDLFVEDGLASVAKRTPPQELRRLYEVLLSMGAPRMTVISRMGCHLPKKCITCKELTTDGYAGPRCANCHEHSVRTHRLGRGLLSRKRCYNR